MSFRFSICLLVLWLPSCRSEDAANDLSALKTNGETNWLQQCKDDDDCGDSLACECGVCTKQCAPTDASGCIGPANTRDTGDSITESVCVELSDDRLGDMCAVVKVVRVCLASCDVTGCAKGLSCKHGVCVGNRGSEESIINGPEISTSPEESRSIEEIASSVDGEVSDTIDDTSTPQSIGDQNEAGPQPLEMPEVVIDDDFQWGSFAALGFNENPGIVDQSRIDSYSDSASGSYTIKSYGAGNAMACWRSNQPMASIWCARYAGQSKSWSAAEQVYQISDDIREHTQVATGSYLLPKLAVNDAGDAVLAWMNYYFEPFVNPEDNNFSPPKPYRGIHHQVTALYYDAGENAWQKAAVLSEKTPVTPSYAPSLRDVLSVLPSVAIDRLGNALVAWQKEHDVNFPIEHRTHARFYDISSGAWSEDAIAAEYDTNQGKANLSYTTPRIQCVGDREFLAYWEEGHAVYWNLFALQGDETTPVWRDINGRMLFQDVTQFGFGVDSGGRAIMIASHNDNGLRIQERTRPLHARRWNPAKDIVTPEDASIVFPNSSPMISLTDRHAVAIWGTTAGVVYTARKADDDWTAPQKMNAPTSTGGGRGSIAFASNRLGHVTLAWRRVETSSEPFYSLPERYVDDTVSYVTVSYTPELGWDTTPKTAYAFADRVSASSAPRLVADFHSNRLFLTMSTSIDNEFTYSTF